MGSKISSEICDIEETPSRRTHGYVEHLLEIQHKNLLKSNRIETKEVLLSRRERILSALNERKPMKPYALQLLEARAAAKRTSSTSDGFEEKKNRPGSDQRDGLKQKTKSVIDHKANLLQRTAARKRSERRLVESALPEQSETRNKSATIAIQSAPQRETRSTSTQSMLQDTAAFGIKVETNPNPGLPATATKSEVNLETSALSSSEPALTSPVRKPATPPPSTPSSPQRPPADPKRPSTPPRLPSPPASRLSTPPPHSDRQVVNVNFSLPNPPSASESNSTVPSPPPSIGDLLKTINKDKTGKETILGLKPIPMEEKMCYGLNDFLTSAHHASVQSDICHHKRNDINLLDYHDNSYIRRPKAEVDRITDSLIAGWTSRNSSVELLGTDEKELSLLSYCEAEFEVPHRPVRKSRGRDNFGLGYVNPDGAVIPFDSLNSVRWKKSEKSDPPCDWRCKRCKRHLPK